MLEIRDVDAGDEAQLRAWYDAWVAAQSHRPPDCIETWGAARVALPRPHPDFRLELFTAYDAGAPVGAGLVNLPMADNTTVAYAEVGTVPPARRRGVGSAVLEEVERRCRAAGRDRALVEIYTPPGERTESVRFAEARGYTCANREAMKALDLAVAEPGWTALEAEARAAGRDYDVLVWRDRVPDEHVVQMCALLGRFMSLVPQGELDLEDGEWTVERFRAAEQRRLDIGAAVFVAVAAAGDGALAAASEVRLSTHDPRVAHVSITMVLPEHRGHRLGLATKLATHRAVRAAFPECHLVVTSNAEVNTHMNAINDALGYEVLEDLLEYHRRL